MTSVAKRFRNALLVATFAAGLGTSALAKDASVEVSVDTTAAGPVIDKHIFGQFAEHLGTGIYGGVWVGKDSPIPNVRGIRTDVVTALKALKVPNVRWPGGCFADEYHWRDGIDPADKRRVQINTNWGVAADVKFADGDTQFFVGPRITW